MQLKCAEIASMHKIESFVLNLNWKSFVLDNFIQWEMSIF